MFVLVCACTVSCVRLIRDTWDIRRAALDAALAVLVSVGDADGDAAARGAVLRVAAAPHVVARGPACGQFCKAIGRV